MKSLSETEKQVLSIAADAKDRSVSYLQRDLKMSIIVDKEISTNTDGKLETTKPSGIFLKEQLDKETIPSSHEQKEIPEDVMTNITSFVSKNPRSPSILDSVYKQKTDNGKRKTFLEGLQDMAKEEAAKTR